MAYFTDQMKEEFRKALEGSSSSKENKDAENKIEGKKKRRTQSSSESPATVKSQGKRKG